MAEPINMHEAKTHFSRLVDRVEAGEEIVIARDGHPVARLVPLRPRTQSREPGLWRGLVHRDPFDRMLVAQAVRFRAVVVTRGPVLGRYRTETVLA